MTAAELPLIIAAVVTGLFFASWAIAAVCRRLGLDRTGEVEQIE